MLIAVVIFGLVTSLFFSMLFVSKKEIQGQKSFDISKSYKYYFTPLNRNKVSLTFDDGPNPEYTPAIVSLLKKHNVPATFFFLGENVFKYPNVAKDAALAGFEIGNHTFTHSKEVHESNVRLQNELRTTTKVIEAATGKTPLFYRPPYLLNIGTDPTINPEISAEIPLQVAFNDGYIPVGADIDSKDWLVTNSTELLDNVMKNANKGHIILLHDGGYADTKYMIKVLEEMIVKLKNDGFEFVSLNELLFPPSSINIKNKLSVYSTDPAFTQEISLLQWFLYTENFFDYYLINGKFDKNTKTALENWQLKHGIVRPDDLLNPEYGVVGQKTQERILAVSSQNKVSNQIVANNDKSLFSFGTLNSKLQHFNLILISSIVSLSKYLFLIIIVLIVSRIIVILGLAIFSKIKNIIKGKNNRKKHQYMQGVSVLIPAYNEEENIESSILSVLESSYTNKEIIVINDGSTDNTALVIKKLQLKYPDAIKLLEIPNGGKANALNVGIDNSKYDVFVAMDADTIFKKNTIKNLVKHFNDPKVGAVAGKVETTNSLNLLDVFQTIEYEVGQNIEKKVFASVNAVGVIPGPVGAWRKSVVMKCGGYNQETLVEDQDLTLAILNSGYKILYEPLAIAYTETPHTLKDFLKQRFRWIYGTLQCAWKYRKNFWKNPSSPFSVIVLPNTVLFSLIVPLFYPIVDGFLIVALLLGAWKEAIITYIIFTCLDVLYSLIAFIIGKKRLWMLIFIPIQRLYYRQIIYYVVVKSILRAIEGDEEIWGKVAKKGDSQKYYFKNLEKPALMS